MSLTLTRALVPYDTAARWEADGRPGFADPYAVHQRAWECFPGRPSDDRNFLTRTDPKAGHLQILLLSPIEPSRPPWCPERSWHSKTIEEATFFSHTRYRFSLLANPTRKVRSNRQGTVLRNSRRIPVTQRDDLLDWIERKGRQHGFAADPDLLAILTHPHLRFERPPKRGDGRHKGILHAVDFQGILRATDHGKFHQAFVTGIGSAKAFGFGMLCLTPA